MEQKQSEYFSEIDADLLESDATYIAHQCNIQNIHTERLKCIAKSICDKWPHAVYEHQVLGNIQICGGPLSEEQNRGIINIFAQRYPSYSKYSNDTKLMRLTWFQNALQKIVLAFNELDESERILHVPCKIGCALAGGNWKVYRQLLEQCANENQIFITCCKLTS
jgi:hypothetical protein